MFEISAISIHKSNVRNDSNETKFEQFYVHNYPNTFVGKARLKKQPIKDKSFMQTFIAILLTLEVKILICMHCDINDS